MKTNTYSAHDFILSIVKKSESPCHVQNLMHGILFAGKEISPGTLHHGENLAPITLSAGEDIKPGTLCASEDLTPLDSSCQVAI